MKHLRKAELKTTELSANVLLTDGDWMFYDAIYYHRLLASMYC